MVCTRHKTTKPFWNWQDKVTRNYMTPRYDNIVATQYLSQWEYIRAPALS